MKIEVKNNVAILQGGEIVITDTQSALDLMATIRYETGCDSVILPKSAIAEVFFTLSTGVAGDILQKFVNYHMKLAIVGDFSAYSSKALRDFIYESNKGSHIFFVAAEEDAMAKLSGAQNG